MKSSFHIAMLTVKSAMRSRIFIFLTIASAIIAFSLPLLNTENGSLQDIFRLRISYTIIALTALLGTATLWISSLDLAEDIESRRIHMLITKPIHPLSLWFGKVIGNSLITATLMLLSFIPLAWQCGKITETQRLEQGKNNIHFLRYCQELDQDKLPKNLKRLLVVLNQRTSQILTPNEIKSFSDEPLEEQPQDESLKQQVQIHLTKTIQISKVRLGLLKGRKKQTAQTEGEITSITPLQTHVLTFSNLPTNSKENFQLQFRFYKNDHYKNSGYGMHFDLYDHKLKKFTNSIPFIGRATAFQTIEIDPLAISPKGTLKIQLRNSDTRKINLHLQPGDGPFLLYGDMSFYQNISRGAILATLFIILLSAIGTSAGAIASPIIALFIGATFFISSVVTSQFANLQPTPLIRIYTSVMQIFNMDLKAFIAIEKLSEGLAITTAEMSYTIAIDFAFKFLILAGIGYLALTKREFGLTKR